MDRIFGFGPKDGGSNPPEPVLLARTGHFETTFEASRLIIANRRFVRLEYEKEKRGYYFDFYA